MMYEKRVLEGYNDRGFDKRVMKIIHDYWKQNIKVTIETYDNRQKSVVEPALNQVKQEVKQEIKPEVKVYTDKKIEANTEQEVEKIIDNIYKEQEPTSYLDCPNAVSKNCYYKDQHIIKYDFCYECVIDKNIWGDRAFELRKKE